MAHLIFVGYTNIFEIFVPQEIEGNRSLEIVVGTNVKNLKHNKFKTKQRTKGESPSQVAS